MGRSETIPKGFRVYILSGTFCSHVLAMAIPASRTDARLDKKYPSSNPLVAQFCEILWRYLIVATTDQYPSLVYMNNDVSEMSETWVHSSKPADSEDSRTILQAYTGRLLAGDLRLDAQLTGPNITLLMRFATPFIQPGSEDLFPSLLGLTLGRFWEALVGHEEERGLKSPVFQSMGGTFYFFGIAICSKFCTTRRPPIDISRRKSSKQ